MKWIRWQAGATPVPVNLNSFEINGELYTITPGQNGTDYSACKVVGAGKPPVAFTGPNTFKLSDPGITYTLHLDPDGLPQTITASFPILPSSDLISVADEVFVITYATDTNGSLRGQGQASIPIANSAFTLTNRFDATTAKFIFADANIYDAGSVVGQFTINQIPTFAINSTTFTLDATQSGGDRQRRAPLAAGRQSDDVQHQRLQLPDRHQSVASHHRRQQQPVAACHRRYGAGRPADR